MEGIEKWEDGRGVKRVGVDGRIVDKGVIRRVNEWIRV